MVNLNLTYYVQYLLFTVYNVLYCLKENKILKISYKRTYKNHLMIHRRRNNSKLMIVIMTYSGDMQSDYYAQKFYVLISMGKNGNNV
jgi:hypothetical protein